MALRIDNIENIPADQLEEEFKQLGECAITKNEDHWVVQYSDKEN
jgi:hypothetical protein